MSSLSIPLYDELRKFVESEDPKGRYSMMDITRAFNLMSRDRNNKDKVIESGKTIFALIVSHATREGIPVTDFIPPFGGKVFGGGKGINYDLNSPNGLDLTIQAIIAEYIKRTVDIN